MTIPGSIIRDMLDPRKVLDPRKATGKVFRSGTPIYMKMLYFEGLSSLDASGELDSVLERYEEQVDQILSNSPLLIGLDIHDPGDAQSIFEIVQKNGEYSPEWWALMVGSLVSLVKERIATGDAQGAAHAMALLTNSRAMLIYRETFEETLWRGYYLGNLRGLLEVWEVNKDNDDEEYWQRTLTENSVVLSQVFSLPVLILQGKAYVGGTGIDRTGANIADFLLKNHLTENTALVEIKTPATKLLASEYRNGVYGPSRELSGALAQISNYRLSLIENASALNIQAFNPPCIVIAGRLDQIENPNQKKSFELYRAEQRNVQIVTYDEVFVKVATLLHLLEGKVANS
jgi:hypothetical protein